MSTIAPTSAQPRHSTSSSTSALDGAASPVAQSRSHSTRTRGRFNATSLQPHLSSLLSSRLRSARWDKLDKEKNRALSRWIAENIKAKMLEVEPKGFKYIVQVQLVENLGQGGSRPRLPLGRLG
ncbi:related to Tctex2-related inner arm dynein light chain [Ustilago bromivora]|uniref:Related to Tctex2-related inner arm dynein light chain n=1 Tax=Ustilago bromivora TaxID=307758 RepID=A0A1K0GEB9_9BASI|nr:related to Tctex2-related inner arm dynein light chain [Ustilago bromivora]